MFGKVNAIFIAPAASVPLESVTTAELVAGSGIKGDRYFSGVGTFSKKLKDQPDRELTLIEAEEIDGFNESAGTAFDYGAFRRNVVVSGVPLNELVGKTFKVGEITAEGIRLCEPCKYLGGCLVPEVETKMAGRAGLRARIVSGGSIRVGDPIRPAPA